MEPIEDNIVIRSRHVPWGGASGVEDWVIYGVDLTGTTLVLTVRDKPGDGGAALISISNAAAGSEGLSISWDPDAVSPDGIVMGASRIRPQIDESTLEGLSWGTTPTSDPLVKAYDLLGTPPDLPQRVFFYGSFTVNPGVGD